MSLSRDDIKRHIVMLNEGSGCLVQPIHDPQYSYILTANHVIEKDLENISISRLLQSGNNWKFESIDLQSLTLNQNYFPHENKDAAIIKIPRLQSVKELITTHDLDNEEGLYLCGFPMVRRTRNDHNHGYRSHAEVEIKESLNYGYREARTSESISWEEVVGISGGGIVKLEGNEMLLAGVPFQFTEADEQLNNIEFAPIAIFDEIVRKSGRRLSPIMSDRTLRRSVRKRDLININISSLTVNDHQKRKLIQLIEDNSERIIFNPDNPKYIINECNEELYRNWQIDYFDSSKRLTFRQGIGDVLFEILLAQKQDQLIKLLEKHNSDILLRLSFLKYRGFDDKFNYSSIPWEYLILTEIEGGKNKFELARKVPIIRNVIQKSDDQHKPMYTMNKGVTELKVMYAVCEGFDLIDGNGKNIDIQKSVEELGRELTRYTEEEFENLLSIDFVFYNLKDKEIESTNSEEFGELVSAIRPDIIHVVGPAEKPLRLIDSIIKVQNNLDRERPYLIIQQSMARHSKGQYINYDESANFYLKETGLIAVMNIPYDLGPKSRFFTITSFYKDMASGQRLSEAYFNLTRKILNSRDELALPSLYIKNGHDISFYKSIEIEGGKSGDPDSSGKKQWTSTPQELDPGTLKVTDRVRLEFESLINKWIRGDEESEKDADEIIRSYKELVDLTGNDKGTLEKLRSKYSEDLKVHFALAYLNLTQYPKNPAAQTSFNNAKMILKEMYEYETEDLDKMIKENSLINSPFMNNLLKTNK